MNGNNMPLVTAVILSYNRKYDTLFTVKKLLELKQKEYNNLEIIVVDNASSDETAIFLQRQFNNTIKIIPLSENIGISGWNIGIMSGSGKYFLLLDDDSHVDKGLEHAIKYLENNPDVGVLALKIDGSPPVSKNLKHLQGVTNFISCGAIIRKDVINKVGYFADWIFIYSNEWEYSLRVLDSGYKIKYFEDTIVIHRVSTKNRTLRRLIVFKVRNELGIAYTRFSFKNFITIAPQILFRNTLAYRKEEIKTIIYCVEGFLKFLSLVPRLKRRPVNILVQNIYMKGFYTYYHILVLKIFEKFKNILAHIINIH